MLNPLLPAGFSLAWSITVAAIAICAFTALVSLFRGRDHLRPLALAVWTVAIAAFPVLGAAAWLFVGRPQSKNAGDA
ncbi:PLDc N-terminal domain-containing protein [Microbacterium rhizomatis]|uniref:Cardiolipin synthase N-terminal domain-containing protein n=1 Tax=Microbacterium rhizomatis TaxID=1631477 RepID=A0A5J5J3I4_9MICO|nr:hypothetical protein F6B43_02765 [Microbacterium rhizomatis]